jgi:hypothetical protein
MCKIFLICAFSTNERLIYQEKMQFSNDLSNAWIYVKLQNRLERILKEYPSAIFAKAYELDNDIVVNCICKFKNENI